MERLETVGLEFPASFMIVNASAPAHPSEEGGAAEPVEDGLTHPQARMNDISFGFQSALMADEQAVSCCRFKRGPAQ